MTPPTYILSVDPGLSGAFCLYEIATRKIQIWDMPCKDDKVSPEGVAMIVDLAKGMSQGSLVGVVENVNSRPRQAGMWSFALGVGIVHGCFAALGVPFELLAPSTWKSACGLRRLMTESQADTKTKARNLAMKLFPESADSFRLVKWDGRAESALMARQFASKNGWL